MTGQKQRSGGGRYSAKTGRPATATVQLVPISIDHSTKLDTIVAWRRSIVPTATKRSIVEKQIDALYSEMMAVIEEAAEMANEV